MWNITDIYNLPGAICVENVFFSSPNGIKTKQVFVHIETNGLNYKKGFSLKAFIFSTFCATFPNH